MIFLKKTYAFISERQKTLLTLILACSLLVSVPFTLYARETISMYLGEVQVMEIDSIERVAIGNPAVASNSILPQGQLVLLADTEGATTMHIWLKDGKEMEFDILVKQKQVYDDFDELKTLLQDIPGATPTRIGELTIVKGKINKKDKSQYDRIVQRYSEVLDLVSSRDIKSELLLLLEDIPNLTVREVAGFYVLSGDISEDSSKLIDTVIKNYEGDNIMNLTQVQQAVAGKMVYMKVRIMEMNKKVTERIGINWQNLAITGPQLEFGVETTTNGGTILNADGTSKVLTKPGGENLRTARGYFGIATGITSTLDLHEGTGDAVILAEPQLSTRSGGKAEFHAGGEYPIPLLSSQGSQVGVEYKKYGIILEIEPTVDNNNNILAHVETEISTIDKGQQFGSYVGLLTRNTSTDVSLREKDTLIIAGLVQDFANKNYDGVKWLADLPILGSLFRSKDFENQRTELVIFITPYIYDASSPLNAKQVEKAEKIQMNFNEIVKGNELLD